MAAIVQPCFDEALATGVAITGNPFKQHAGALFINTQVRGFTVTSAAGNELPEQVLVTSWTGDLEFEVLGYSSLTQGAPILQQDDMRALSERLFRIHDRMLPGAGDRANAIDVEFVFTLQREFVFVQARPYRIVYELDRIDNGTPMSGRLPGLMRLLRRIAYRFLPNRLAYRPPG